MQDPELSIDRALDQYLKLGYSENWINQRLKSIELRKDLTDEWKNTECKELFNDIISVETENRGRHYYYAKLIEN